MRRIHLTDIIGIIYPRRCPVCDKILRFGRDKICAGCYHKLEYIHEPRCKKCGKQILKMENEYCFDCKKGKHLFEKGLALINNNKEGKRSVYAIKYNNKREYVDFYTDELVKRYGPEIEAWKCDMLVPVPLHRRKKQRRGYNQAEVIALSLGKKMNIPIARKALKRIVNTRPQKELNDIQRKKNLERAFLADENIVKLRSIILVDDIYTTGNTIDACARALKDAGARAVYYVSISIGKGY